MSEVTERRVHASRKGVPSAVVWTVRRWCLDCAAGPKESSTSEVLRLQKLCRRNGVCSRHHASRNVSWLQRPPSAVGRSANLKKKVLKYDFCGFGATMHVLILRLCVQLFIVS